MRLQLMKIFGLLFFGFVYSAQAQYTWGTHAFTYLNQLNNAKNAGVGGRQLSPAQPHKNKGMLTRELHSLQASPVWIVLCAQK